MPEKIIICRDAYGKLTCYFLSYSHLRLNCNQVELWTCGVLCCRGTKFRLTVNLWTQAGLTNGAEGIVHSIIYEQGKKPPAQPVAIIATFESYLGPAWRDAIPKSVVITPYTRSWAGADGNNARTMLPMILG